MMKYTGILLAMLLPLLGWAQERVGAVPCKADRIVTDNLGYLYGVKGDQLLKLDADGKVFFEYSDKLLGEITAIDASDPMKLLLHYQPLTRIAFLDNQLSVRGEPLALDEIGHPLTTLSCTSHSNGLWLYDNFSFELIRLDRDLREDRTTGNLVQVLRLQLNPDFMFEENNWVYLHDRQHGMLVFDIYGTYYKTIPMPGAVDIHFRKNQVLYRQNGQLVAQNLRTQEVTEYALPDFEFKQMLTTEDRWYFLTDTELILYKNTP